MDKIQVLGEAQVQPHDTETEQTVLATLMRFNDKFALFGDLLNVSLFYNDKEKVIYQCIEGVINEGGITDINSLVDYKQRHLPDSYVDRVDMLNIFQKASTVTFEQDIKRLRLMSKQRTCWILLQQASQKVLDPTLDLDDEINGCITALSEVEAEIKEDGISSFGDALDELKEIVNDNANGRKISLPSGFKLFDEHFLLRPTTLTVIAAFTSVGKSSLAMNIALNVAKNFIPVAYYSLEMGKAELASRSISKEVGVSASIILNKQLTEYELANFDYAVGNRKDLPIYIDERSTVSFDRTIRSIRTMVKTKGIKLVVIDYLQIYSQVNDNNEASLGYMARLAKNIAKEMNIAVIVLSQLNRSGAHPAINMMRGSGQIEESADHIVLIDRPEAYPDNKVTKYEGEFADVSIEGTAKLILAKGRGVGTGCSMVKFDSKYTQFSDMPGVGEPREDLCDMEAPF